MLANFVHGNAALLRRVSAQFKSRLNLFAENSLQSVRQPFAQFQTEAHGVLCLFVCQPDVAVTFFASHLPPEPGRRLESSASYAVGEFHFRHYQTGMSSAININLNEQIFPGNVVAYLAQTSPGSPWPKRSKLFRTEPDLAFFPVCAATHFKRKRCGFAFFAETNLPAGGFGRQITLRYRIVPPALEILRQLLNQKFAFNFPIVSRQIVQSHEMK